MALVFPPEPHLEPALRARGIAVQGVRAAHTGYAGNLLPGGSLSVWARVFRLQQPTFFFTPGKDLREARGVLALLGPPLHPRVAQEGIWLAQQWSRTRGPAMPVLRGLPLTLAWAWEEEPGYLEGPYFSQSLWQAARRRAWQALEGPLEEARKAGVIARGGLYSGQEFLREAQRQGLVVLGLPPPGLRWGWASRVCSLLSRGALGVLVVTE